MAETFPEMKKGQSYGITIQAFNINRQKIVNSFFSFKVLSSIEDHEVTRLKDRISKFNFSEEEKTYLVYSLLKQYSLNDESIRHLQSYLANHIDPNPKPHRLLADVYLDVGNIYLANRYYIRAQQIAIKTNNQSEVVLAQQGLRYIASYSQDPNNKALPQ
jgi:hypothetical protein